MTGAAGRAGYAYTFGVPYVTPSFLFSIFFVFVLVVRSSYCDCLTIRYFIYLHRPCFMCSRLSQE